MGHPLAGAMSVQGQGRAGHIVTSNGLRDVAAWGTAAEVVDFSGPVDGPGARCPRFSMRRRIHAPLTWQCARLRALRRQSFRPPRFSKRAAQRRGRISSSPPASAPTFRYRFVFHTGDEKPAKWPRVMRFAESHPQP